MVGERFKIIKEIGRGGMGVVYEAIDRRLSRRVAVKKLRPELRSNEKDLMQFLSEARLVAQLKHPHIVEIYSIIESGSSTALVFEFVEGKSLLQHINAGGPFPLATAISGISAIASALDYAHGKKIIHRDLKPANIMMTPQGLFKVMDFGIAHRAQITVARITRVQGLGTPAYMAPEQEIGQVSRSSDIYSLGIIAYEMLTGASPFSGPNFLAQKRERVYAPPSRVDNKLPAAFDAVIDRALSPEPSKRFQSGAELAEAVKRLQAV